MDHHMEADVLVVGAGASGVPAAIGAARQGVNVILLEEDAVPGGAAIDQFVLMPDGGPRVGVCAEIVDRLARDYPLTDKPVDRWYYYWYMPSDYLMVVAGLIRSHGNIRLICGAKPEQVMVDGNRVTGVTIRNADRSETRITAKQTIDATGSAEVVHVAGAKTRYGREAQADFDEQPAPPQADENVQLCTWQYISQRLDGYPDFDFSRLGQCHTGLKSGYQGVATEPVDASPKFKGIFLHWGCRVRCPDTRDPAALAATQQQALALIEPDMQLLRKHGFTVQLAPRIGVRESRRIIGDVTVTFNDLLAGRIPDDSVVITNRDADIWTENKTQMDYPAVQPYGIPLRALLPCELENLTVVGKSLSGTHLAMSAYRVQCILAIIGQAAGIAAALAATGGTTVRGLAHDDLHRAMSQPGQSLSLEVMRRQVIG